ncbi:MAG: GNAT family N-acetyltransferase [Pyrinomonadaceae bacterium]|nr:GNAT family N-acetyltransferase [Pyrinomonadaceae bacterium]
MMLETSRLLLRKFEPRDLAPLAEIFSDPEVMKHIGGKPRTLKQTCDYIVWVIMKDWIEHGFGWWAVEHKETGKMLGYCGLRHIDDAPDVDLGYCLARECWGRGYATEGARASLRYGFEELQLEQIYGVIAPDNTASLRVLEKLGMRYRKAAPYCDWAHDLAYYAVTRDEYRSDVSFYKSAGSLTPVR